MNDKPAHRTPARIDLNDFDPNHNHSALVPLGPVTPIALEPWAHPAPEDGCLYRLDQPHTPETRADDFELEPLSSFVANNPAPRPPRARRRWFPWASVGLYLAAQLVLAAAIGIGQIPPIAGIALCLTLLVCGLTLIAGQVMSERPRGGSTL